MNTLKVYPVVHLIRVRIEKTDAAEGDLSEAAARDRAFKYMHEDLAISYSERISPTIVDVYFEDPYR